MSRERVILGLAAVLALVSTAYYRLPITAGLLFILVEMGGTLCLGRLILKLLRVDEGLARAADIIALSFTLGYGASILLYVLLFLSVPHGLISLIYIGVSVASLAWAAYSHIKKGPLVPDDSTRSLMLKFLAAILCVLTFTFMLPNFLPIEETNSYYLDNVFWVGNNVELTYSIPPGSFRNALATPTGYHYHYLSSMRMALVQTVLDIPAFEACFAFSFFDTALMLASSASMFAREFLGDKEDGLPLGISIFLLVFSTGIERATSMSFISHLYVASFGFCESFSCMLLFLSLAKRFWERSTVRIGETLVSSFILALCMGSKGALGFVCLIVAFVLCLTSMFSKKRRSFALVFGIPALVSGIIIYFLFLSGGIFRNVGQVTNVRTMMSFPHTKGAYEWIRSLPLPRFVQEGIFVAGYVFISHPVLWGLSSIALVKCLKRKSFDVLDAALLIGAACCIVILRVVHMKGFSQSYFYMAATPLMWGYVIRRLSLSDRIRNTRAMIAACAVVAAMTLSMGYQVWMPKLAARSVLHLAGREIPSSLISTSGFRDNVVSPEAYNAMVWVRENLPEDALYMADVYDSASRNNYYPGAISQRHVIMQWNLYGLTNVDYSDDVPSVFRRDAGAMRHCEDAGIQYLMQLVSSDHLEESYPGELQVVYRENGVSVYRLV